MKPSALCLLLIAQAAGATEMDACRVLPAFEVEGIVASPEPYVARPKSESWRHSCTYHSAAAADAADAVARLVVTTPGEKLFDAVKGSYDAGNQPASPSDRFGATEFRRGTSACKVASDATQDRWSCSGIGQLSIVSLSIAIPRALSSRSYPLRQVDLVDVVIARVSQQQAAAEAPAGRGLANGNASQRLQALRQEDEQARAGRAEDADMVKLALGDEARKGQAAAILQSGGFQSAADYYNAALIFMHGNASDDFSLAHSLASIAAMLDPGDKKAKWLKAAAWDRHLQSLGKPQWYGTQYVLGAGKRWELYAVDEKAVSDADRVAAGVPTLSQALVRVRELNLGGIQ